LVIGDHFTMDFFVGPNYRSTKSEVSGNDFLTGDGVGIRFGLTAL